MQSAPLSSKEEKLWHTWKIAHEAVMARVGRDITEATGLSDPDFGVLSRLVDDGDDGEMRQSELAESMRWDKSRLSHQLTRMEGRGYIQRRPAGSKGVFVGVTAAGQKALTSSRPIHSQAVREQLLLRLSVDQRAALLTICELLVSDVED